MTSLIQRKARTGRDAQAARAMTLGRALRLTAVKQAEQLMGLAVSALGVTRQAVSGNQVKQALDGAGAGVMLLMDGPAAQVGAILLDPPLVLALIQQQIMGKVAPPHKRRSRASIPQPTRHYVPPLSKRC